MPPTILVIDNHRGVREALQILLEVEGYRVLLAADGREAQVALDTCRPDLVLLDPQVPICNGWEIVERLLAMPERVPVVLLTTDRASRARGEAYGLDALDKYDVPALVALLHRLAPPWPRLAVSTQVPVQEHTARLRDQPGARRSA